MWYLWIALVVGVLAELFLFYRFIMDQDPFIQQRAGDIGELLQFMFIFAFIGLVWPLSVTVFLVDKARDLRKKRSKRNG